RRSSLLALLLLSCGVPRSQQTDPPPPNLLSQPQHARWREQAPAVYRAAFETSRGRFVIEVQREWSPIGADHFYNLVRNGYYNDARFHRVLPNYIVQWGLHGDPAINRIWRARKILDDAGPQKQSNTRGTIGYAMTGPNDRATQVYINLADNSRNDGQGLNPFGRIIEGMAVVDSLYNGYGPNSGNGVRQGQQGPIEEGGNAYLQREFPNLDFIKRARVERRGGDSQEHASR
ncbi:MAG: peptidylprolyl isomerase, partial [Gemmatimonadota bacterium]